MVDTEQEVNLRARFSKPRYHGLTAEGPKLCPLELQKNCRVSAKKGGIVLREVRPVPFDEICMVRLETKLPSEHV